MIQLPRSIWAETLEYIPVQERVEYILVSKDWKRTYLKHAVVPLDLSQGFDSCLDMLNTINIISTSSVNPLQWAKASSLVANLRRFNIRYAHLPRFTKKTDELLREMISEVKKVSLNCQIQPMSLNCLWVLGLGFTEMCLELKIPAKKQLVVLERINPNLKTLVLNLEEPNQKLLDKISIRFKKLKSLSIHYDKINVRDKLIPSMASLKELVLAKKTLLVKENTLNIMPMANIDYFKLVNVAVSPKLEKLVLPIGPSVVHLSLISCNISKPNIERHFPNVKTLLLIPKSISIDQIPIIQGLKKLRVFKFPLGLFDYDAFSNFEAKIPQITALEISLFIKYGEPFWPWVVRSFPNIISLTIKFEEDVLHRAKYFPARGYMPSLKRILSNAELPLDFYLGFKSFAPNLKLLMVPAKVYEEYLMSQGKYEIDFQISRCDLPLMELY